MDCNQLSHEGKCFCNLGFEIDVNAHAHTTLTAEEAMKSPKKKVGPKPGESSSSESLKSNSVKSNSEHSNSEHSNSSQAKSIHSKSLQSQDKEQTGKEEKHPFVIGARRLYLRALKRLNRHCMSISDEGRDCWDKKADFLFSVIGFAVDLGNVWRFPYICYRNGGGAFLVPYFLMLIFVGMPLFYMELALGQFHRNGMISVWSRVCPLFTGVGYGICVVATLVGSYYNTIIAWAFYFLLASLHETLPWSVCNRTWNTPKCIEPGYSGNLTDTESSSVQYFERELLQVHKSSGIDHVGPVKTDLAFSLIFILILVYVCMFKGIKMSGKVVWITATLPYFILFVLLIRGLSLPGSMTGIKYYLYPEFQNLLVSGVWIDAAAQIFFSLGPGFGALLALSSYNHFNNNVFKDAILVSSVNCATSFLAGLVVFAILGYMAELQHTTVDKVAAEGPGLVFVVYPEAIATLAGSHFWAIIFFIMLITLGIDSTFGGLEASITAIADQFPVLGTRRPLILFGQLSVCFLIGLATCTYGGTFVVALMDFHSAPTPLIFFCLIEVIAVSWIYGLRKFSKDIKTMMGFEPGLYWKMCWFVVCPITLTVLLLMTIISYEGLVVGGYVYPTWSLFLGWLVSSASIVCVPGYIVYKIFTLKGTFMQRLQKLLKPVDLSVPTLKISSCEKVNIIK